MQLTTLKDFLHWASNIFKKANLYYGHGTNNAWDEAIALALHVLGLSPNLNAKVMQRVLTLKEKEALEKLVNYRVQTRIPVPYLTQEAWFAHLKFYVDERVIIPRSPLGELILKGFKPWLGKQSVCRILDLCTGSGCLAIACADVFKQAKVDAVDISEDALMVAEKNVALHKCEERVSLFHSDLFNACSRKQYDIIISNPPYVSVQEMQTLPPEYRWEPKVALAAGTDGLQVVKAILREAPNYLTEKGLLFVEVGSAAHELQLQYPQVPFTWLEFERGGEGVFLLTAEDKAHWAVF